MQFTVDHLDCTPFLSEGKQPTLFIKREKPPERDAPYMVAQVFPGQWHVADKALQPGQPVSWAVTKEGEFVRVPLFSYTTPKKSFESVFGSGLQLGALATHDLPSNVIVAKMLLVLGNVYDVENGYQLWAGVAYRIDG